ncbi:hypothetical protein MXB_2407 [Myxobolus squamalis]|nr:hypothetical protein MXB_2407 [Myxobolus squamalis]
MWKLKKDIFEIYAQSLNISKGTENDDATNIKIAGMKVQKKHKNTEILFVIEISKEMRKSKNFSETKCISYASDIITKFFITINQILKETEITRSNLSLKPTQLSFSSNSEHPSKTKSPISRKKELEIRSILDNDFYRENIHNE